MALSAFGRGKTHFAKSHGYDRQLLVCDFVMIVAASALVGLLNRVTFEFDQWPWVWLGVVLLSLLIRNLRLGSQGVQGELWSTVLLMLGLLTDIAILVWSPSSGQIASWASAVALLVIAVQFWLD